MDEEDAGYIDGLKKAYELVGNLADFYKNQKETYGGDHTCGTWKEFQGQENACRYAQHVIRKGEWNEEEELPW